jgi:hypothetical protein
MVRRSYTAVVERGEPFVGDFATEPYEAGWASEALFFVRVLEAPPAASFQARVQLSPDGLHWIDEGSAITELPDGLGFVRVREFGNWLRLAGTVRPAGTAIRALVYLVLKE